jgi:hypothetical protein
MIFGPRSLKCSFCRRKDTEVAKLVAGPRVYICDRCVAIAAQLMEGPPVDERRSSAIRPTFTRRLVERTRSAGRWFQKRCGEVPC